jgi:hypothetical protein
LSAQWIVDFGMSSYAVQLIMERYPDVPEEEIRDRLNYCTFVDLDRHYMYYEVPKAGCTSIKTLIHDLQGLPPIKALAGTLREVRRDMLVHDRHQFVMKSLTDLDDETQRDVLSSDVFFRFTVVRNPYTRLRSAWRDKVRVCAPGYEYFYETLRGEIPTRFEAGQMITFREFVDAIAKTDLRLCNHHWRLQSEHIFSKALKFSRIGALENLGELVSDFLARANYPTDNRPPGKNHAVGDGGYDRELAAKVYRLYQADFLAFGYDAEPGALLNETPQSTVSEARFVEELAERNVVIGRLYAERAWLRTQLIRAIKDAQAGSGRLG